MDRCRACDKPIDTDFVDTAYIDPITDESREYATCEQCQQEEWNEAEAASEEQSLDYFNKYIAGDR